LSAGDPRLVACERALSGEAAETMIEAGKRTYTVQVVPTQLDKGQSGAFAVALEIGDRIFGDPAARRRAIFETADDLLLTLDLQGRILTVSTSAERLLGYSVADLQQTSLPDLVIPEQRAFVRERLIAMLCSGRMQTDEVIAVSRAGQHLHLEISLRLVFRDGQPVCVEGLARDVTERHQLEEHVRQAQKMEAIGVLAGGIAHDFNNLLTGILGYAYLLQSDPEIGGKAQEGLDVIVKSAERAAQLTTQLLGFARRGKKQNVPVDVHATIRDLVELLGRTIDKQVHIAASLRAEWATVVGDPGQIYQLLLNLCLNARDAMPGGGDLTISTRSWEDNLVVTVTDTGTGIDPEIRERIFEPFFTTKPPDKGSGMGLSMVYGIARNHGGSVHLESRLGEGSAFHVTLPYSREGGAPPAGRREGMMGRAEAMSGRGRILVIDDEEIVRHVLSRMLRGLGYEVVTAGDSRQAVQYFEAHHTVIDAVILDMVMPRMSGRDCYSALKAIDPDVRAVLSSGYSRDDEAADLVKEEGLEFLQKPYQLEQLAVVIRRALAKRDRSGL
jgi:PAS domain S-box-containing protein